jgi:hypothetical protein
VKSVLANVQRRWAALGAPARLYLAWQLAMPIVAWALGSHRFSWAMYSQFQPAPEVLVQREPGGPFERVDLVSMMGHLRAELSYGDRFVREVCRESGARAVRLIRGDLTPTHHRC